MMDKPTAKSYSVTIACPECGGDVPYEVEATTYYYPNFSPTTWVARDQERACGCQMFEPQEGMTDEQAYGEAWFKLDQQAIAKAQRQQRGEPEPHSIPLAKNKKRLPVIPVNNRS